MSNKTIAIAVAGAMLALAIITAIAVLSTKLFNG